MVSWWPLIKKNKKNQQRNSSTSKRKQQTSSSSSRRTYRLSEIDDVPLTKRASVNQEIEKLKREEDAAKALVTAQEILHQHQDDVDYQTEDESASGFSEEDQHQQDHHQEHGASEHPEAEKDDNDDEQMVSVYPAENVGYVNNNNNVAMDPPEGNGEEDVYSYWADMEESDPSLHLQQQEEEEDQSLEALQQELQKAEEQFSEEELEQMIQSMKVEQPTLMVSDEEQIENALKYMIPRELTQKEARRTYSLYNKLAQPSREKMVRDVVTMDPINNTDGVTVEEVISLPWMFNGSYMNVKKINELIAGTDP